VDPRCIDPRQRANLGEEEEAAICPNEPFEVPLTPGRDFGQVSLWNAWVDSTLVLVDDTRYGLDTEGTSGAVTFGLDRSVSSNLVAGASIALETGETDGFDGNLHSTLNGFTVGPYIALRLSDHWAIDASATYSRAENDLRVSVLDGDYITQQFAGNINLHGQYDLGFINLRPQGSVFYAHAIGNSYEMKGNVLGRDVTVAFPESQFDYGAVEASTEINKVFFTDDGRPVMPYAEFGARYDFERPNDGEILTGDLTMEATSPWAFTLRSGLRMMVSDATLVEASAGYLSFGQDGLDVWEGRFFLSFGF
jgi:outer membrane autotransporter protein